jgi:biopolymer transport protein ExbD
MRILRYLLIALIFFMPTTMLAAVGPDDLPDASKWYFHADFKEMRSSEAGKHLYAWLQDEVFQEVLEETGIDLEKEADQLTAFATVGENVVVVIEGNISQDTKDKVLAIAGVSGSLDKLGSGSKAYYFVGENDGHEGHDGHSNIDIDIDSFDDGAYFSFALKNKILITATEADMEKMIANNGKYAGAKNSNGALFVLSAERSLMQAGVKAGDLGEELDWDSNILRNTEQAALIVADEKGRIAIEAQLRTTEKEMADSLASIVRGLISLQIFNDDLDPGIASLLQNTRVDTDGTALTIKISMDPEAVMEIID